MKAGRLWWAAGLDPNMNEIRNMLKYFWETKEDIESWGSYEEYKHLFPEVIEAVKRFKRAKLEVSKAIWELGGEGGEE